MMDETKEAKDTKEAIPLNDVVGDVVLKNVSFGYTTAKKSNAPNILIKERERLLIKFTVGPTTLP